MELAEALRRIETNMEPPLERQAVQCIRERKEEAIPLLLERLKENIDLARRCFRDSDEEENALWYHIYLLAEFRVREAFAPLVALLELHEDENEWLLGDGLTEDMASVLASCAGQENFARLREIALNEHLYLFCRTTAVDAAAIMYAHGLLEQASLLSLYSDILARAEKRKNEREFASMVAGDVVELGLSSLYDTTKDLFDRGILGQGSFDDSWESLTEMYPLDRTTESALKRFRKSQHHRLGGDTLARVAQWSNFREAAKAPANVLAVSPGSKKKPALPEPNDPCPCGSGLKFKRCCMLS